MDQDLMTNRRGLLGIILVIVVLSLTITTKSAAYLLYTVSCIYV